MTRRLTGRRKVALAKTAFGFVASLVSGYDDMDLCEADTPQSACAMAARKLRRLARKFEELATHERPASVVAQKEVNGRKRRAEGNGESGDAGG